VRTMRPKRFRLKADELEPLAVGFGVCIASDLLTVEGRRVGYMYREPPQHRSDSGWRFLAGTETEAYLRDPENSGAYDVNALANLDPEILPLLEAPVGSAFRRVSASGPLVAFPPEQGSLNSRLDG